MRDRDKFSSTDTGPSHVKSHSNVEARVESMFVVSSVSSAVNMMTRAGCGVGHRNAVQTDSAEELGEPLMTILNTPLLSRLP